jgi:hypothetical protein
MKDLEFLDLLTKFEFSRTAQFATCYYVILDHVSCAIHSFINPVDQDTLM